MGRRPTVSLAASAREWSDRFHRFLLDHGGGVVGARVMTAEQALDAEVDALLIDDVCSFLTPRLVIALRKRGQAVVGVFDSDDGPDAKRRLLEAGISDVIESSAPPEAFLSVVVGAVAHLPELTDIDSGDRGEGLILGITGPPGGVGVTEVAIGLARALNESGDAVLVDLNQVWPGVGQRLGLPVYPNLRSAVDLALHEPARTLEGLHDEEGLPVVSGLADPDSGGLPVADLVALLGSLSEIHTFVVVDFGPVTEWTSELLLSKVDALMMVGLSDPVGLTRLTRIARSFGGSASELAIVVNRVSRASRRRDELLAHLKSNVGTLPVVLVPYDRRIERAAWDGKPVGKGGFQRQMRRLARVFEGSIHGR